MEFALTAPLLLPVLGIISCGFMLSLHQKLSQAVAEGARAAINFTLLPVLDGGITCPTFRSS